MAKILIVDDDPNQLVLLQDLLEEMGHSITTAYGGQQALKAIEQDPPDLIISDVMMPVVDGYTLLRQVRSNPRLQLTKMILMSAAAIKPIEYRADAYIKKPYNITVVEDTVSKLIPN